MYGSDLGKNEKKWKIALAKIIPVFVCS